MMKHFRTSTLLRRFYVKECLRANQTRLSSTTQDAVKIKTSHIETLGQPSSKSHPHLVKPGEVVSGIQLNEVVQRRDNLVKKIVTSKVPCSNHIAIIPSSTTFYMSEDVPYVFRQDTDFRYLTGCLEPDTALVLSISSDQSYKSSLFTREKNSHTELWDGPRTGVEQAVEFFGVDEAHPMSDLKSILNSIMKNLGSFSLWYDFQSSCQPSISESLTTLIPNSGCEEVMNPEEFIHSLRVVKSEAEQSLMAETCKIISECFVKAMRDIRKLSSEHQVYATLDFEARMKGAEILAYPPVVACGNNANVIHYIKNNQAFSGSEFLLVDAGCELHGYCSDVTRTWPVSGKFSDVQQTLYDVLFFVQEESLMFLKSRRPSLDSLLEFTNEALYKRLSEAHVLTKLAENHNHRVVAHKFCPHHVGHYLGMDVHDTATIPRKLPVIEGMVVTVEPGVYIRHSNDFAKEEFKGCGIRIEDDVLITSHGINILSTCPKSTKEIEALSNI